jgi:peroxiredoxin-like protein
MQLPIIFKVKTNSQSGINKVWKSHANEHSLITAIPNEFEGPGGGFSPEDLYALSLANCFLATFKVIAEKSRLNYESLIVETELQVDLDSNNQLMMKKIIFNVTIINPENKERALRLLDKTPSKCMILNSVLTEKQFIFQSN